MGEDAPQPGGVGAAVDNFGLQFGLLNMLRTGNPVADMALALMVPLLVNAVLSGWADWVRPALQRLLAWMRADRAAYERTITFEVDSNSRNSPKDERNNILMKAISLYIGQLQGKVSYKQAQSSLMAIKEQYSWNSDLWQPQYGSTAEQLGRYSINDMPAHGNWVELEDGIWFCHTEQKESEGDASTGRRLCVTTTFTFRSYRANGDKHVHEYLNKIFNWYKTEIERACDTGVKYMFVLSNDADKSDDNGDSSKQGVLPARRYKLHQRKTFNTLFFPEKEGLLRLIANFTDKTGRYAIEGYPHKLGLLLYGEPGTGKTSVIKAIAQLTGRHILQVPLNRIKTNQTLVDLMFQTSFDVPGEDMPVNLKQSDVIFVFEDVDCCSNIVKRRGGAARRARRARLDSDRAKAQAADKSSAAQLEDSKAAAGDEDPADASPDADARTETSVGSESARSAPDGAASASPAPSGDADTEREGDSASTAGAAADKDGDSSTDGGRESDKKNNALDDDELDDDDDEDDDFVDLGADDDDGEGGGAMDFLSALFTQMGSGGASSSNKKGGDDAMGPITKSAYASKSDKLTLAGLLNALDGPLEAEDRIVIMTTNHPELLDPALIRPGRIDRKIHLTYCRADAVCSLIQLYYGECSPDTRAEVEEIMACDSFKVTPASLEGLAAEVESEEEFVARLRTVREHFF